MIESRAKRLALALFGAVMTASALGIAATGERADVGVALLAVLPFGLAMLIVGATRPSAPGSRDGMDVRVVEGRPATVFAISGRRAALGGLGCAAFSLAGVGMAVFAQAFDEPIKVRIVGIVTAVLFGAWTLRGARFLLRARTGGAVGEVVLTPDGLELRGMAGRSAVPWDSVCDVVEAEYRGNAYLGLAVSDRSAIRGSGALTPVASQKMIGADIGVSLRLLQADPALLVAAVRHVVEEPHDRAILGCAEAPEAIVRWLRECGA